MNGSPTTQEYCNMTLNTVCDLEQLYDVEKKILMDLDWKIGTLHPYLMLLETGLDVKYVEEMLSPILVYFILSPDYLKRSYQETVDLVVEQIVDTMY
jgi:hypothetical protein